MMNDRRKKLFLSFLFVSLFIPSVLSQSFTSSNLDFGSFPGVNNATSLEFGPDGKLYVAEEDGLVKVYTVVLSSPGNYDVTAAEVLTLVESIPNHNDDTGNPGGPGNRQVTGITVAGTAADPVVYVSSSDRRRGAGGGGGDANLDTNSGVITRLTKNGGAWSAVDIVRGLPRSEENHATNGMQFKTLGSTDWLIVCSGGFTNAGAPSNNFAYITEYALSGAVLAINLTMLNGMTIQNDGQRDYIYDIPTLDDPTRANVNGITDLNDPGYDGIDVNDPWGGNDGLNMAMLVPGSPVTMFSSGYRNTYDLIITEDGHVYVTDNGANGGWGGYPEYEGDATQVTNNYRSGEPGSNGTDASPNSTPFDAKVNNSDHLNLVTTDINTYSFGSVYGGHPCPVRANANAGLFTRGSHSPGGTGQAFSDSYFRTQIYDPNGSTPNSETDPAKALPANWPPVDVTLLNPADADFRQPTLTPGENPDGPDDIIVVNWSNNTNGIAEYTASNFGGVMKGDLIAGKGGSLHRVDRDSTGAIINVEQSKFSVSGNALGVDCQGDTEVFPGTIWIANYNGDDIVILAPDDITNCLLPGDVGYDPLADTDSDGYTNDDEIQNGSDPCSGASQPTDFDEDLVSDLLDLDDDGDGINDDVDPLQLGTSVDLPFINELFLGIDQGGYLGLGFTGLMNNGDPNPNYLDWQDDPEASNTDVDDILGGAIGAVTMYQTTGDAATNDQEKAYQYGVNVDATTNTFTIHGRMFPPFHNFSATESQGMFMGDGFQSDFVKFVMGQNYELSVVGENANSAVTYISAASIGFNPAVSNPDYFDLFLVVEPSTGSVQARYQESGGIITDFGSPFTIQGNTLTTLQSVSEALIVGIIGTADVNDGFAANWDFLNVLEATPFVSQPLPDLNKFINAADDVIGLDSYFNDDGGASNLTFTVQGNTDPTIGASIVNEVLTITYPAVAASTTITIRATDADNQFVDESFDVNVTDQPVVIFRVNAGDVVVPATDAPNMDWAANEGNGAQAGTGFSVNTGTISTQGVNSLDASVPAYAPISLYAKERYDVAAAPEMNWSFATGNGNFIVNLYMGNGFGGTSAPGQRIFDIEIEGALVADDKDLSQQYGHKVGAMESYTVVVSDGELNIEFLHVTENPLINAIEILSTNQVVIPPIVVTAVPTQQNELGDEPVLSIIPSGGDANETFSFAATGLPPGLTIEPTNGSILGIISTNPADIGVYSVTVTVSKPSSTPVDVSFDWEVVDVGDLNSALVEITPGIANIDASTFGAGAFQITNTSSSANITGVSFDLATGFISNMVFDPNGTAGDATAKGFTPDADPGVGTIGHTFGSPLGNGGFQSLDVTFTDFNPGELFTFSLDQDPTSVEGLIAPGPNESGSVSGLEQAGTTVTVTYDDGSVQTITLFADGSAAGATAIAKNLILPAPAIQIQGFVSPDTTAVAGHTLLITGGVPNGTVAVLQVEAGFFQDGGNLSQEPFEVNSIIGESLTTGIQLDGTGAASVPITLVDTDPEAGYNYFLVAQEDGTGYGAASAPLIAFYDASSSSGGNVLFRVNTGGPLVAASDAPNPDWGIDQGVITAAGNSPYLASVSTGQSVYTITAGSAYPGPVDMTDPSLPAGTPTAIFETERYDNTPLPPMEYKFPVATGTQVEVRLYFAELFNGITGPGQRVFDVSLEGVVPASMDDLDAFATAGPAGAFMRSHSLTLLDDTLNIEFINGVQNPAIKGIEIIDVTNAGNNAAPIVTNPGIQNGVDGDVVSLPILATDVDDCGGLNFQATGLPPSLTIDPVTGVISGTLDVATGGTGTLGAFQESNGLVIIETETGFTDTPGGFNIEVDGATTYLTASSNNFGGPNGQIVDYQIDIYTPGVYRVQMKSEFTGTNPTEENDSWIKFDNTTDVHYLCVVGGISTEQELIDNINGTLTNKTLYYPAGNAMGRPDHGNENPGSNGYFKSYRSGGGSNKWQASTIDNNGFPMYVYFPNAGTFTMSLGERSAGHKVDRLALYKVDTHGNGVPTATLDGNESVLGTGGGVAASANSPYNVTVTVTDDCVPSATGVSSFVWNVTNVATTADIAISATLQGRTDNSGDYILRLYPVGSTTMADSLMITADALGNMTATGITPGDYQVALKFPNSKQAIQVATLAVGNNTLSFGQLATGDADNNNLVDGVDFSILVTTFNVAFGGQSYDPRADFNGDGKVDGVDFSLLVTSFNTAGANPTN